jgi:hypothetical protein
MPINTKKEQIIWHKLHSYRTRNRVTTFEGNVQVVMLYNAMLIQGVSEKSIQLEKVH